MKNRQPPPHVERIERQKITIEPGLNLNFSRASDFGFLSKIGNRFSGLSLAPPNRCLSRRERFASISPVHNLRNRWRGVFPAITTQLQKTGALDLDATARHAEALIKSGVT